MRRAGVAVGLILIGLLVVIVAAWAAGVLHFTAPGGPSVRATLPVLLGFATLVMLVSLFLRRWRWRALLGFAILLVPVAAWWTSLRPSTDRPRQPDVAKLASATMRR